MYIVAGRVTSKVRQVREGSTCNILPIEVYQSACNTLRADVATRVVIQCHGQSAMSSLERCLVVEQVISGSHLLCLKEIYSSSHFCVEEPVVSSNQFLPGAIYICKAAKIVDGDCLVYPGSVKRHANVDRSTKRPSLDVGYIPLASP